MSETEVVTKESEYLGSMIREAIGKDQFLSFSRSGESPIQWIQKLHVLDNQGLPDWPMLTPLKVQMQKCDRCDQLFCSSINLRRHVRVRHLRQKNSVPSVDENKLRKFWDELSLDDIKEIVSIENANLENSTGSSIIASLTSLVQKKGFSQPQACLKASFDLLSIVQGECREKVASKKLFKVLDDASEKTFLCGKVELMQNCVYEDIKFEQNAVACASILVEQKLVKAFNDHEAVKAREIADTLVEQEEKYKKSGKGMQKPVQSTKQKKEKSRGKAKMGTRRDEDASRSCSGRAEPQNFERDIVPRRDNEEEEANHPSDARPDEDASGSGPGHAEPQNVGGEGDIAFQLRKQKEKARKYRQKERKAEAKAFASSQAEPQNVDGFTGDAVPQRREEEEKANDLSDTQTVEDPSGSGSEQAEPQNVKGGEGDVVPQMPKEEEKTNGEVKESIINMPKVQGVPPAKTPILPDVSGSGQSHQVSMPLEVESARVSKRDEEVVAEVPLGFTSEHDETQSVEKATSLATGGSSRTVAATESEVGAKGGEDHIRLGSSSNISGQGTMEEPSVAEAKADIMRRLKEANERADTVKLVIPPRCPKAAFLSKLANAKADP